MPSPRCAVSSRPCCCGTRCYLCATKPVPRSVVTAGWVTKLPVGFPLIGSPPDGTLMIPYYPRFFPAQILPGTQSLHEARSGQARRTHSGRQPNSIGRCEHCRSGAPPCSILIRHRLASSNTSAPVAFSWARGSPTRQQWKELSAWQKACLIWLDLICLGLSDAYANPPSGARLLELNLTDLLGLHLVCWTEGFWTHNPWTPNLLVVNQTSLA